MKHDPLSFGRRAADLHPLRRQARQAAATCGGAALGLAGAATGAGLADLPGLVLILGIGAALSSIVGLAAVSEA